MKNLVKLISLSIIMVLFSCSNEPIIETFNDSQDIDILSRAKQTPVSVWERPDGPPDGEWLEIEGASSTLHRSKNGITVNFKTNGLIPNNAYTVWWVVFDNPGTPPGPPTQVSYATGHITGKSGIGNFTAHLKTGSGFNNPLTAEVHVVLRSHGQAVPGLIPNQILTDGLSIVIDGEVVVVGSCDPSLTFHQGPTGVWSDSDEVGYCANIQVAMHPKVNN